jgi:phage shock protein PspC (stress-responsive transcriptional regulator)
VEKKLYRSRTNRVFLGVAGGLAEYFDVDPVLVRLLFVVLTVFSGVGIILYIIGLIVIPEEPVGKDSMAKKTTKTESEVTEKVNEAAGKVRDAMDKSQMGRGRLLGGLVLILLGLMFLGQMFWPTIDGKLFVGALFILIGVFVLTGRR